MADFVGHPGLTNLFVANMTGNTVAMVANLTRQEWSEARYRAFPNPLFVVGAAAGSAAIALSAVCPA